MQFGNRVFLWGIVMLATMVMGVSVVGAASFTDINDNHENSAAINYCFENEIVKGYEDGTFGASKKINRAEFTKIVIGAKFSLEEINSCDWINLDFTDVATDQWFANYVCVAKREGIIKGYEDGSFGPDRNISFAEAAKIIASALSSVDDAVDEVWYRPFVNALVGGNAVPTSIYSFNQNLTRGQMAEMIYRIKAEITDKDSLNYDDIVAREDMNLDDVVNLALYKLQTTSGSYFWEMEELVFEWKVDCENSFEEAKNYKGMAINADAMDNQNDWIQAYFEAEGFVVNACNVSAGVVGSVTGYTKDKLVCVVMETITGFAQELEQGITTPSSDKSDVKVRCAEVW